LVYRLLPNLALIIVLIILQVLIVLLPNKINRRLKISVILIKGVMLNPILDLFDNFKGLPRRYLLATRSLKRNPDILITKADKGNNVVILDRSDYIRKAHSLLHDNSTYQKLRSNPYPAVIESFRKNLKRIAAKCPDPKFFDRFRTINPSIPYFYGLPKTHNRAFR